MKEKWDGLERRQAQLRSDAERRLVDVAKPDSNRTAEELLHELQVHQIELEMQNEALRQAQVELEESRDRYVDLYEFAPVGYFTLTEHGLIEAANLTGAGLLGVERKQLLRDRFDHFVAPPGRDRWQHLFVRMLRPDEAPGQPLDLLLRRGDGSTFHAHLDCVRTAGKDQPTGLRVALSDISALQHAAQALGHQTALLRQIMDSIPDLIFVKDANSVYLACNKAFERFAGRPESEQVGKTDFDFFEPDTARLFRAMDRQVMESGQSRSNEEWVAYPDGHKELLETLKAPFFGKNDELLGLVGISRNVTARRQSEAQIKRFNRVLRTISACNEVLVRARDEAELLNDICRDIVEIGGYLLAWVAEAAPGDAGTALTWYGDATVYRTHAELDRDTDHVRHCLVHAALSSRRTQVCNQLETLPECAFVALSALGVQSILSLPLLNDDQLHGALTIYSTQANTFDAAEIGLMEELAADLAYGIAALRTAQDRDRYVRRFEQALQSTVTAMARTLEMRDPYTAGHQQRVSALAVVIAREMGLDERRIEGLKFGGLIHDIGKIGVPAEILSKPGRLTPIEYRLVQQHPEAGSRLVADIDFPWPLAEILAQHHERMDGSGYPAGLKGDEILLEARILAVADVVEAMSSHRPYRPGLGVETALAEIERGSGRIYDAQVAAACLKWVRGNDMRLPE